MPPVTLADLACTQLDVQLRRCAAALDEVVRPVAPSEAWHRLRVHARHARTSLVLLTEVFDGDHTRLHAALRHVAVAVAPVRHLAVDEDRLAALGLPGELHRRLGSDLAAARLEAEARARADLAASRDALAAALVVPPPHPTAAQLAAFKAAPSLLRPYLNTVNRADVSLTGRLRADVLPAVRRTTVAARRLAYVARTLAPGLHPDVRTLSADAAQLHQILEPVVELDRLAQWATALPGAQAGDAAALRIAATAALRRETALLPRTTLATARRLAASGWLARTGLCAPPRVRAVAVVVDAPRGAARVLLARHDSDPDGWQLPKLRIAPDAAPAPAAASFVERTCVLRVRPTKSAATARWRGSSGLETVQHAVRLTTLAPGARPGSDRARWVPLTEAPALLDARDAAALAVLAPPLRVR